jgi:hypothetical protein
MKLKRFKRKNNHLIFFHFKINTAKIIVPNDIKPLIIKTAFMLSASANKPKRGFAMPRAKSKKAV